MEKGQAGSEPADPDVGSEPTTRIDEYEGETLLIFGRSTQGASTSHSFHEEGTDTSINVESNAARLIVDVGWTHMSGVGEWELCVIDFSSNSYDRLRQCIVTNGDGAQLVMGNDTGFVPPAGEYDVALWITEEEPLPAGVGAAAGVRWHAIVEYAE